MANNWAPTPQGVLPSLIQTAWSDVTGTVLTTPSGGRSGNWNVIRAEEFGQLFTTDDSGTLAAFFAYLSSNTTRGAWGVLPAGTIKYSTAPVLSVTGHTNIVGMGSYGSNATVLSPQGCRALTAVGAGSMALNSIRHLQIDCSHAADASAVVYCNNLFDSVLEDVFLTAPNTGSGMTVPRFMWAQLCSQNKLDGVRMYGTNLAGQIGLQLDSSQVQLVNCEIDSFNGAGAAGLVTSGAANSIDSFGTWFENNTRCVYHNSAWDGAFTGKIDNGSGSAGNILTVTSVSYGLIGVGSQIYGLPGIAASTTVTAVLTGVGGIGTYTVNGAAQLVASSSAGQHYSSGHVNIIGGSYYPANGVVDCIGLNSGDINISGINPYPPGASNIISILQPGLKRIRVDHQWNRDNVDTFWNSTSDMLGVNSVPAPKMQGQVATDMVCQKSVASGAATNIFNICNGSGSFVATVNCWATFGIAEYEFRFSVANLNGAYCDGIAMIPSSAGAVTGNVGNTVQTKTLTGTALCNTTGNSGFNVAGLTMTLTGLSSVALTFTGAPAAGATSATLNANWTNATGTYAVNFSDGEMRVCALTNGATTCTWTAGLSSAVTTAASTQAAVMVALTGTTNGGTQIRMFTALKALVYDPTYNMSVLPQ